MNTFHHLKSADSTNDKALELARLGALDGTVVMAETQQAGRGRRGRDWFSPASGNVYLSYVHRSRLPLNRLSGLTLDVATALSTVLEDVCGLKPQVKWPNDLLLDGKKVAGVLTELHTDMGTRGEAVVIAGVGLNLNMSQAELPDELKPLATSVLAATGETYEPVEIGRLIAVRMREKLAGYEVRQSPDLAAYCARFPFVGSVVQLGTDTDSPESAVIQGIAEDGGLEVVRQSIEETEVIRSGEVVFATV